MNYSRYKSDVLHQMLMDIEAELTSRAEAIRIYSNEPKQTFVSEVQSNCVGDVVALNTEELAGTNLKGAIAEEDETDRTAQRRRDILAGK